MIYGMYDTVDNIWLGTKEGPFKFDSKEDPHPQLRDIRAQMLSVELGYPSTRVIATEYIPEGLRIRDEVKSKRTPLEALVLLEEGAV